MIFCINCNVDFKDDDEFYKIDDLNDSALETLSDHDCEPIEGGVICKECLEFITNSCSNDVQNENIVKDVESTEVLEVPSSPQPPENEKEALKLIEEQNEDVPSQGMKRKLLNEDPISVKTARIEGTTPAGPSASRAHNSKDMKVIKIEGTDVLTNCLTQKYAPITESIYVKPASHVVPLRSSVHNKESSGIVNDSENKNILLDSAPSQSETEATRVMEQQTLMCMPVGLGKETDQSPSKCVQNSVDETEGTDNKTDEIKQKVELIEPKKRKRRRGTRSGKKKRHGVPRNGGTRIFIGECMYRMPKYPRPLKNTGMDQESVLVQKDASENSESAFNSTTDAPSLNNAQQLSQNMPNMNQTEVSKKLGDQECF